MADSERGEGRASTRVAELEDKVHEATRLIGELRETNYSLSGEVAELRRELESRSDGGAGKPEGKPSKKSSSDNGDAHRAELEALRKERKTIREKLALLLERIEKLET